MKKIILDENAMMDKIFETVRKIDGNFEKLCAEFHVMPDGKFSVHVLPKGSYTNVDSLACVGIEYDNDQSDNMYDENGNPVPDEDWDSVYFDVLCEFIDREQNRIMRSLEKQLEDKGYNVGVVTDEIVQY